MLRYPVPQRIPPLTSRDRSCHSEETCADRDCPTKTQRFCSSLLSHPLRLHFLLPSHLVHLPMSLLTCLSLSVPLSFWSLDHFRCCYFFTSFIVLFHSHITLLGHGVHVCMCVCVCACVRVGVGVCNCSHVHMTYWYSQCFLYKAPQVS